MRIGETLLTNRAVTPEHLEEAIETQRFRKVRLGRLLRDLGHLTQSELNMQLVAHFKPQLLSSVSAIAEDFRKKQFSPELIEWSNRHDILPYEFDSRSFSFFARSFRDEVLESAELVFKRKAKLALVDSDAFKYLKAISGGGEIVAESQVLLEVRHSDDQKIAAQDPYTSLFRDTILAARESSASDIHIQPTRNGVEIRFRINGDLTTWKVLEVEHRQSFINEVKRLTNLSIAVSGKAQDARVSFKNWKLDIRTSLLPSQYGEKIVLRLLDLNRSFELSSLGFDDGTLNDLKNALKAKNGVILISGPTGSGKTSTLYTLLSSLDRNSQNILTLEDPIEYGIDGITQVQVNSKLGFSDALRAVLRQDPDVILVGEVRDAETADLCAKAAMTGHLVLSTLHANGAPEVVSRLLNLGVEPFVLKSCLRFSAAQRLVRILCSHCARPLTGQEQEEVASELAKREFSFDKMGLWKCREPSGCGECKAGVVGRLPILEYMRSHEIEDFLFQTESQKPRMTRTLSDAALKLAERGEIDVFEALEID